MICKKCGCRVSDTATFCEKCGAPMAEFGIKEEKPQKKAAYNSCSNCCAVGAWRGSGAHYGQKQGFWYKS